VEARLEPIGADFGGQFQDTSAVVISSSAPPCCCGCLRERRRRHLSSGAGGGDGHLGGQSVVLPEAHSRLFVDPIQLFHLLCGPRLMLIDTVLALEVFEVLLALGEVVT
jgi:hypothetical protein